MVIAVNDLREVEASGFFDRKWYLDKYADVKSLGIDPIEHYLRFGAMLLRDPSPKFDTEFYLTTYNDVSRAGVNPLLHYIRFGRKEGRLAKARSKAKSPTAVSARSTVDVGDTVFVSCWLKNPEALHDGLIEFYERLRRANIQVVFVTDARPLVEHANARVIRTGFSFRTSPATSHVPLDNVSMPDWLQEVVRAEWRWQLGAANQQLAGRKYSTVEEQVRTAYLFWRELFKETTPRMMFVWGSTAPMSKLHLGLCRELSIPTLVFERGHFPKTFCADLLGQFAYAGINLRPQSAIGFNQSNDPERYQVYAGWVKGNTETPYRAFNSRLDILERISDYKASGHKVVLFIGVNDLGSGVGYHETDCPERHSFLFQSTRDAVQRALAALELVDKDAKMILKPHPSDQTDYCAILGERITVATDTNINALIGASDACISMSTTALARAVIEDKPIVLLGLSELSMKGIAYECLTETDLPALIRAALAKDNFEQRKIGGQNYIRYLFEDYLIGMGDAPTHHKVESLTKFVERYVSRYTPPDARAARRKSLLLAEALHKRSATAAGRSVEAEPNASPRVCARGPVPVDVVIPVYGDAVATRECIESVIASRAAIHFRIVIICDNSPCSDVRAMLEEYRHHTGVELLHNEVNLGYPGTANRGIAYSDETDVILLNSDTLCPPGWVDRLQVHALSEPNVGTVTPLSNNASIYSVHNFPSGGEITGGLEEVLRLDQHFRGLGVGGVQTPVPHGFCVYLRRPCIRATGFFDEFVFGKGYSEEVDFGLRARQLGFIHRCATDVFVGHVGGVSFGDAASERRAEGRKVIAKKYPNYFNEIRSFIDNDPLAEYRLNG